MKDVLNKKVAALLVAAGHMYSDELLMATYRAGEIAVLRKVSTALRKSASKLRAMPVVESTLPVLRARANGLDSLADQYLHEAQALEKK